MECFAKNPLRDINNKMEHRQDAEQVRSGEGHGRRLEGGRLRSRARSARPEVRVAGAEEDVRRRTAALLQGRRTNRQIQPNYSCDRRKPAGYPKSDP